MKVIYFIKRDQATGIGNNNLTHQYLLSDLR